MVPAGRRSLLWGVVPSLVVTTLGLIVVGVGVGVWAADHEPVNEHQDEHVRPAASLSLSLVDALYKDATQPIDLRVKDLVGRM